MKRILYSCLFFTLLFVSNKISGQSFNGTLTPSVQCYAANNNSVLGVVTVTAAGAVSYTWSTVANPPGATSSFTSAPTGTSCAFTLNGCGVYTIGCAAINPAANPPVITSFQKTVEVVCPTATVAASTSSICPGGISTLSATASQAGTTWTWTTGANTASISVSPSVSTCYTVTGTTPAPASCSIQASTCITVQPISVTVSPVTQTVCAGTTVTLTALTTPTNGVALQWASPGGPLGTASTQTASPGSSTTYSVTGSINSCSATAVASVAIDIFLSIQASSSSASVCPTQTTVLTATSSALTYTWIPPSPATSVAAQSYTATGPGNYTVIGKNGTCTGSFVLNVPLNTSFQPTITPSSTIVCPGETFTINGYGGAAGTYTWASIIPGLPPTVTPINATPVGASSVVVSQTVQTIYGFSVTSPQGCTGYATTTVNLSPPVTTSITASSFSVCATSPVTLTASGSAVNYTWTSTPPGTYPNTGTIVVTPTTGTTYSLIGSNAAGYCTSAPATTTINMITGGTLTLTASSSAATICPGQSTTLTASGALSYTWSPGTGLSTTTGAVTTASPSASIIYTVTGDNNGGCSGSATIAVAVAAIPNLSTSATSNAVCAGFTSTITAFGASSYTWTGSTLSNPVNQPSISVGPGTYTVQGSPSGANCPSLPAYVTIALSPPLNIILSQDQTTTCITSNTPKYSKPVVLTASGAATYAWFPYNPAYMTYSLGPTTTVRPPTSTCYTVTGATSVCSGTAVICVTVVPQFTMEVVPPQPAICLGDSVKLSIANISTLAVGPSSAWTYSWTEPNTAPPPSLSALLAPTVMAFPTNTNLPSTYTVEMSDSRSCISLPRLVTVTVLAQPVTAISIPTINNVPTSTVCFVGTIPGAPDNLIQLTASNANPGGLPFGVSPTYTWLSPYIPSSIVTNTSNPTILASAPNRLPIYATYTVVSGYNGVPGCLRMDTVTIHVIDCRPVVSSAVTFTTDIDHDTICTRNCITYIPLSDTLAGGPQTYSWTFRGGNPSVSTASVPTVCYNLPGNYDVVLTISNPYPINEGGSSATKASYQYVQVVDVPNVMIFAPGQLASDTTIRLGQSVVLKAHDARSYIWSPNSFISSTTKTVVTVSPQQTTQYILTGYNSSKCYSSDTVNVIIIEDCGEMYVPNAFSPNNDGTNDVLYVRGICLETLTFMIFDRWGEKVFETTDILSGWDGTFHGEKMNTGVFVYRLEGKTYSGKGFSSKGNITLIR